ncbi:pleckstrin homology domain-containing family M member 1-like [Symsagittifera roscoffensis]|uniref:pleckstrin homology domain-containing family M member 1-like n=1 Tax=Symsagittifera roscoffensis TaxID=84072 RepID=UPI00307BD669
MSSNGSDLSAKVRDNILYNLKLVIKKLLFNATATQTTSFQSSDVTHSLCYVLEAIFLFGLKSPYSTNKVVDPATNTKVVAPSFWPFVLKFTHSDVSTQLGALKFITNETGLCRSWIRMALNDGLFSSYVELILNGEMKIRKKFYNKEAFWFQSDQVAMITGLLFGIDNYKFEIAHNVSLLNSWGTTPLELAGYFKVTNLPVLFPPDSIPKTVPAAASKKPEETQAEPVRYVDQDVSATTAGDLDIVITRRRRKKKNGKSKKTFSTTSSSRASTESLHTSLVDIADRSSKNLEGSEFNMEEEQSQAGSSVSGSKTPDDLNQSNLEKAIESESKVKLEDEDTFDDDLSLAKVTIAERNDPVQERNEKVQKGEPEAEDSGRQMEARFSPEPMAEVYHFDASVMFAVDDDASAIASMSSITGGANDADVSDFSQRVTPSPPGNVIANRDGTWTDTARSSPNLYALMGLPHIGNRIVRNESTSVPRIPEVACEPVSSEAHQNPSELHLRVNKEEKSREPSGSSQDFELIPQPGVDKHDLNESITSDFKSIYTTLTHEKGLPSQNYMCKGCSSPIGTIYGKFKVCAFDSKYYCARCHSDDEAVIPAYIVNNWDFTPYKVCCAAKTFLTEVENEPLIDFDVINNNLYEYIQPLRVMFDKRKRLKYAANYLFSCSETTSNEVKSRLWPKDYMLSNLHLYSVQDLLQIQTGYLQTHLQRVLDFCIRHISTCVVCKQKGFICEICRESEIIYAFDVEGTATCEKCHTVFHKRCKSDYAPCPKCVRRASYTMHRTMGFGAVA